MEQFHSRRRGFTLVELIITVVIVAIVSVMGTNALLSRFSSAAVEEAAKGLASDLAYARSAANLKGCQTRIILCSDKNCSGAATATLGNSGGVIVSGSTPVRYYAILRQSFPCTAADAVTADGYDNWDFDLRPRALPQGVDFHAIYQHSSGVIVSTNSWTTCAAGCTSLSVANALYFTSNLSPSSGFIPVTNNPHLPIPTGQTEGNTVAFQIQMSGCSPAASDDCLGYFVTISPGGTTGTQRCSSGTRADHSLTCY